jgi:hypothetical protein
MPIKAAQMITPTGSNLEAPAGYSAGDVLLERRSAQ